MSPETGGIPYVRRCVLDRAGRQTEAVLCRLSRTGAYLTFLRPLKKTIPVVGETVRLSFLLPGEAFPIEVEAVVAWQNLEERDRVDALPVGCGLTFAPLTEDDRRRIDALIEDYHHSPQQRISPPAPHSGLIRVPYVEPCLLIAEAGTWEGVVCNVSLQGAYVTMDPIPPAGERARLFFRVPGRSEPLEVPCEVVWINTDESRRSAALPAGCGLHFFGAAAEVGTLLERLVQEYESLPRS